MVVDFNEYKASKVGGYTVTVCWLDHDATGRFQTVSCKTPAEGTAFARDMMAQCDRDGMRVVEWDLTECEAA